MAEKGLVDVKKQENFYKIRLNFKIIDLINKNFQYPKKDEEFFALKRTKFSKDCCTYFTKKGSIFNSFEKARKRAVYLLNHNYVCEIINLNKIGGSK